MFSSISLCRFLILSPERKRENQPSRRRKQEPIDSKREAAERWYGGQDDREFRARGGSVEWVEKRRKGMGGGKFVKRGREKDREEGGGGDERM